MTAKSDLNQYCQQNHLPLPEYTVINRGGPLHKPYFVVRCAVENWEGKSDPQPTRKKAKEQAAKMIYALITQTDDSDSSSDDDDDLDPVTVMIDGDNVHEVLEWVQQNRSHWDVRLFVTQDTVTPKGVKVLRNNSDLRDATDVAMIIFVTRYLPLMAREETLLIVSRDKIFETLEAELDDSRIYVVKTIQDLQRF